MVNKDGRAHEKRYTNKTEWVEETTTKAGRVAVDRRECRKQVSDSLTLLNDVTAVYETKEDGEESHI